MVRSTSSQSRRRQRSTESSRVPGSQAGSEERRSLCCLACVLYSGCHFAATQGAYPVWQAHLTLQGGQLTTSFASMLGQRERCGSEGSCCSADAEARAAVWDAVLNGSDEDIRSVLRLAARVDWSVDGHNMLALFLQRLSKPLSCLKEAEQRSRDAEQFIRLLVEQGANINAHVELLHIDDEHAVEVLRPTEGSTLLLIAVGWGYIDEVNGEVSYAPREIVQLLLDLGVKLCASL